MLYQLSYASIWFLLLEKEIGESLAWVVEGRTQSLDLLKITQLAA
jgi:hypothetical protein